MMEGMGLTPVESNLHKNDLVVIFQIMPKIEEDHFWHLKTYGVVLTDLWRRWDKRIHEQKNVSMHCKETSEVFDEIDGIDVIDL